ncbi:ferrochelatase [Lactococcus garvieae]|jgi:ferrochelatase|uniref:Coproporphyrin III ferrochelatase n=1 Tax=Lactococcus garvieae DCC43 TaxID=1231377 RepID=K2PPX3_9LACT|nr:ferrochelatase [Lactococcus garvieae]EKF52369.1 Ferrochelatase, protoheme ferro-lyase [Lactococcus garvieae DCC43]
MKKRGILLVNLGTPESTSPKALRKYLRKFLSDRRVIKTHPLLWQPLLNGVILNTRPKKSAKLYEKIVKDGEFPLLTYTLAQEKNLKALCPEMEVAIGMSYSVPSIETSLDQLLAKGVEELTVIPMYPQYSGTTVGSVFDSVMNYFMKKDHIVDLNFIRSFYKEPLYIKYFADKIKEALDKEGDLEAIVFSYHGIPLSYVKDGDAYPEECTETTRLIMKQIGDVPHYQTYQSKFGPAEWLTPATDDTLKKLPSQGIKKILILAPGFVVDCLETIEELEEENKTYFLENGGEKYIYLSPFNDEMAFAELVKERVERK